MSAKYNKGSNSILMRDLRQMIQFINEIGGDLDADKFTGQLSVWVYRANGEKALMVAKPSMKDALERFNEWYDLDIDLKTSFRKPGAIYLKFNTCPNLPDEEAPVNVFEDMINTIEQVKAEAIDITLEVAAAVEETVEVVVEEVEKVIDEVVDAASEVEIPNWTKLSSPTTGKKKLVKMANDLGIEVDAKAKYKEILEEFRTKFEEANK